MFVFYFSQFPISLVGAGKLRISITYNLLLSLCRFRRSHALTELVLIRGTDHAERLCDILRHGGMDKPQNMSNLSNYLVFDTLCDLVFGKSFDLKELKANPLKNIAQSFDNYTAFMSNVSGDFLAFNFGNLTDVK
jgi:hypothetical protein